MHRLLVKMIMVLTLSLGLTLVSLTFLYQLGQEPQLARAAGARFVAPGGVDGGNDCSDSLNPCATLQYAVDVAGAEDIINIAAGVYTGVNAYGGLAQVVYISKSLTLRGGYPAGFTEPPDPEANPTTLDAEGLGRVLYITGDVSVTIEGLRITGGDSANLWSYIDPTRTIHDTGGGIYVVTATINIENSQILNNWADWGGGIHIHNGTVGLVNNTIKDNTARLDFLGRGGGIFLSNSRARVISNTITANTAGRGVGLYIYSSGSFVTVVPF